MTYPVALRRAAGVLILLAAAAVGIASAVFVTVMLMEGEAGLFVLVILSTFLAPTFLAIAPMLRVGRELWAGRHAGDRMLFWSLLFVVAPLMMAFRWPVLFAAVGAVLLANVLYAVGTLSKYDPPG